MPPAKAVTHQPSQRSSSAARLRRSAPAKLFSAALDAPGSAAVAAPGKATAFATAGRSPSRAAMKRNRSRPIPTAPPLLEATIRETDNGRKTEPRPALCAVSHGLFAHWRGPNGVVQLALCPPHGGQIP